VSGPARGVKEIKTIVKLLIARSIIGVCAGVFLPGLASALEDQLYIGVGGGSSWLAPNPVDPAIDDDENIASYGSLTIGRDLSTLTSVQFQLHSLGEAKLTNQQTVGYNAADVSILYRFFDSRDRGLDPNALGFSFYGRFGLGGIFRDPPDSVALKNDTVIYFTGGAGLEFYLNHYLGLRLEAAYLEEDALYGGLSLIGRFGGSSRSGPLGRAPTRPAPTQAPVAPAPESGVPAVPAPVPPVDVETQLPPSGLPENTDVPDESVAAAPPEQPTPAQVPEPVPEPMESPVVTADDRDADGIVDSIDQCADSAPGFPVRSDGCPVFKGVLSGVEFVSKTATLVPAAFGQLDALVKLLKDYPEARVQMIAHTDNEGTAAEQSQITRGRLRTIGTYLVRRGIRANRLILRSIGGNRPAFDNSTPDGRKANNRVELLEYR